MNVVARQILKRQLNLSNAYVIRSIPSTPCLVGEGTTGEYRQESSPVILTGGRRRRCCVICALNAARNGVKVLTELVGELQPVSGYVNWFPSVHFCLLAAKSSKLYQICPLAANSLEFASSFSKTAGSKANFWLLRGRINLRRLEGTYFLCFDKYCLAHRNISIIEKRKW